VNKDVYNKEIQQKINTSTNAPIIIYNGDEQWFNVHLHVKADWKPA